jgi:hypothetical protein
MTKAEWKAYREAFPEIGVKLGDTVVVHYHWNFGRTVAQRDRRLKGTLDIVNDDGISLYFLQDNRISYKALQAICPAKEKT